VSIVIGYDNVTLREQVDEEALEQRLAEIGEGRSRAVLNEKVGLLRLAGRLEDAWDVANEAVRQARFSGDREELTLARIRRAQVQQALGKLDAALVEITDCVTEARTHDWAAAEAFGLQHRGKVRFDLGEMDRAIRDFRDALTIRVRIKSSPDEIDSTMFAITVAESLIDGGAS
jgi:predicted negative regulator of RcsB-dependent stress response